MRKLENENLSHDGFVMLKRWMENRNAGKIELWGFTMQENWEDFCMKK